MTDSSTAANPFDINEPDEQTELADLVHALQMTQGFALFFVRCNLPQQRERLLQQISFGDTGVRPYEIHFPRLVTHLLDELRIALAEIAEYPERPAPNAIFVSGLEYSLPIAETADRTALVANLNASRNSFSHIIPCPLVLWVPEYVLTAITRGAPDFFSVRSGVYYFYSTTDEMEYSTQTFLSGEEWVVDSLPADAKQERIAMISALLQDYQALPGASRNLLSEGRLLNRLANYHLALGYWQKAVDLLLQSLNIWRSVNDRKSESTALANLGIVYNQVGLWDRAEIVYQQGLEICRELGDKFIEAEILGNLGNLYFTQGRWDAAEDFFRQSLTLSQQLGDGKGSRVALNNLGSIYVILKQPEKAEEYLQESLLQNEALADQSGVALALSNLGNLYQSLMLWAKAESVYNRSIEIKQVLGDRLGEGLTIYNLAVLKAAQNDLTGALELAGRAIAVLESTEDTARLLKVRRQFEEWEQQKAALKRQTAPEADAASGAE